MYDKKTIAFGVLAFVFGNANVDAQITTQTYTYTGAMQTWTVPQLCVNAVTIETRGARCYNPSGFGGSPGADLGGEGGET